MPVPLDEFPVHQAPLSMAHVVSSDRNADDRYYFNGHGRAGDPFFVTGFGVYPNLGVVDAFATVRTGDRQVSVRVADALGDDRMQTAVGPYRIEVVEPLQTLRIVLDADDHGLGFDLTWRGSFPAILEEPHVYRPAGRIILDAQRFAQVGTWEGVLRVEGTEITIEPDTWLGTRDRSWGIRPVGEPEPPGRGADEGLEGFWWCYVPLRFEEFALVLIVQESPDGTRTLNQASRVWPAESGKGIEQLGWPEIDVRYRSGTRHPEGATIELRSRDGKPLVVEVDTLGFVALNAGPGYGGDPTWTHGAWKGRDWIEGVVTDLTDPAVAGMVPFSVVDHACRATCDGAQGWGLFELGTFGRHDPSGFQDYSSVAP
jgi:hypothetical protein